MLFEDYAISYPAKQRIDTLVIRKETVQPADRMPKMLANVAAL